MTKKISKNKQDGKNASGSLGGKYRLASFVLEAGPPAYGGLTVARIPHMPTTQTIDKAQVPGNTKTATLAASEQFRSKVALVKGAIPGETVEVVAKEKKDYYTASVTKIIDPSPDRVEPKCRYFGPCGGCQFQYVSYGRQIKLKEEVLADCLRRIGGINAKLSAPITSKDGAWNYRFRGQFKISDNKIGFYKEKSKEIIDIEYCPLMVDGINEALDWLRKLLKGESGIFRDIKEAHISYGDGAFAFFKTRVNAGETTEHWDNFADLLLSQGFKGLLVDCGSRNVLKYGNNFVILPLDGLTYTVSPASFYQANWGLNQAMAGLIKDILQPLKDKRILDLFSGAGNFSLPLAKEAGEVFAVEENPYAVNDTRRNLQINSINNMRLHCFSAETFDLNKYEAFDVIVLDPPRAGLPDKLAHRLLKTRAYNIVYVSCNPSTFSRDLKKLSASYEIKSVRLVDMFPQTYHVESLAFLKAKRHL